MRYEIRAITEHKATPASTHFKPLYVDLYSYMHNITFAGKLTRDGAEKLLDSKPAGSYLVRLSTKIWGYTVSVQST